MQQVGLEFGPARIGSERHFAGLIEQVVAHVVERAEADVAAAGDVDGGQVERQANQEVAHGADDELVDLIAHLLGHTRGDVGGTHAPEDRRVEERLHQRNADALVGGVDQVDGVGQHRVAETEDGLGKFGCDVGVDLGLVLGERGDVRAHAAREELEHDMLILHLVGELCRLEDPLAVPLGGEAGLDLILLRDHVHDLGD